MALRKNKVEEKIEDSGFIKGFSTPNESYSDGRDYAKPKKKLTTLTMKIDEDVHRDWKIFFINHKMTLSSAITNALNFIIKEENNGNIRITKDGILKNN